MKNINKSFYIIIFLIAFILLGMYLYLNQTNSEENINVSENNAEVENIISQKEDFEESQPKEIRIVAEEILYPDEYDFGEITYDVILKVGKAIKFNALSIVNSNPGDIIEIELGGITFESTVLKSQTITTDDETLASGIGYIFSFESIIDQNNSQYIRGNFIYDTEKSNIGTIYIVSEQGDYNIYLSNGLAYYVKNSDKLKEEHKRGYKID